MQLISEKLGQEIGRLPNRIDQTQDPESIGIDFVEVAESHVLFFGRVKDFIHGELPEEKKRYSRSSSRTANWIVG